MSDTEYALAEALLRCLELAREGAAIGAVAAIKYDKPGWWSVGQCQAKFDGIIAVADSTLAAYGLEGKHVD